METVLPKATGRRVDEVLGASRARLERACALGDGLRLAQWHNCDDAPSYAAPGHHTVSVYLAGGFGTYLAQHPGWRGSPGRVCILPAEHESHWVVEGELRFLHLYVSDLAWADRVVRLIDAEPRAVTLDQRIYVEDAGLAHWAALLAGQDWTATDSRLRINGASHAVLDRLVLAAARPALRGAVLRPRGESGQRLYAGRSRRTGRIIGISLRPHVPYFNGRDASRLGRATALRPRLRVAARPVADARRGRCGMWLRPFQPSLPAFS